MEYIQQQSMLEAVRQAVREELQPIVEQAGLTLMRPPFVKR
jgi:hypothetical protein